MINTSFLRFFFVSTFSGVLFVRIILPIGCIHYIESQCVEPFLFASFREIKTSKRAREKCSMKFNGQFEKSFDSDRNSNFDHHWINAIRQRMLSILSLEVRTTKLKIASHIQYLSTYHHDAQRITTMVALNAIK